MIPGNTYYIEVWPYSSSDDGTYDIAVNTHPLPDPSMAQTSLTDYNWKPGEIETFGEIDLYTFTPVAADQYIHFRNIPGTLYVQVYDTNWQEFDDSTIYSGTTYMYLTGLSTTDPYYIKVWAHGNNTGTYDIKFNALPFPDPMSPPPRTSLTPDTTWSPRDITTPGGNEWFEFIAGAVEQYIHFEFGTLNDINVQVYDNGWQPVQGQTNIYDTTTYKRLTGLTSGQKYYIRVWPWSGSGSGTYKIGVTGTATPPTP